jgi:hypothetical protein
MHYYIENVATEKDIDVVDSEEANIVDNDKVTAKDAVIEVTDAASWRCSCT